MLRIENLQRLFSILTPKELGTPLDCTREILMTTETITIPIDPRTAQAYAAASAEERAKIRLLLGLRLQDLTTAPSRSLQELMDEIGRKAEANGLTPQILESLLDDR
jgi:hypothetical protein